MNIHGGSRTANPPHPFSVSYGPARTHPSESRPRPLSPSSCGSMAALPRRALAPSERSSNGDQQSRTESKAQITIRVCPVDEAAARGSLKANRDRDRKVGPGGGWEYGGVTRAGERGAEREGCNSASGRVVIAFELEITFQTGQVSIPFLFRPGLRPFPRSRADAHFLPRINAFDSRLPLGRPPPYRYCIPLGCVSPGLPPTPHLAAKSRSPATLYRTIDFCLLHESILEERSTRRRRTEMTAAR